MKKINISSKSEKLIISIIIFILSFPKIEPDFSTGLDSPYMWALNYLINYDYSFLKHLIFPIGILGFLKHPIVVGNNVLIAILFFSLVKFLLIYLLLELGQNINIRIRLIYAFVVLIVSCFISIDLAIIGCCALLLLKFSGNKKYVLFILSLALATLGLLIKSSIGVNAFSVIFVYIIYNFFVKRNIRQTLLLMAISVVVILLLGLLFYQNIQLLLNFFWGVIKLMQGYSSALALFPSNSWLLLTIFIISIISVPFVFKESKTREVFFLLLPATFFMWKHAISREEAFHYSFLLGFVILFWAIIFFTVKRIKIVHAIIPILSIFFLWGNLQYIDRNNGFKIDYTGLRNFTEVVFSYKDFIEKYKEISINNIKKSQLSNEILNEIRNSSVDIYPWDFSYIPANNLIWKPRTTLQSGAFSSWLDKKSAHNFQREIGADYILFHLMDDGNYGKFGSIDNRYILNDEPNTIIEIFKNYTVVNKTDDLLLLKKNKTDKLIRPQEFYIDTVKWNEWIFVPQIKDAIVRAKFFCKGNIFNSIKSFLYKGEILFIDYKLDNGKVISYRFVESNARDGLWINPFIQQPSSNEVEPKVEQVRFRCSNPYFYNKLSVVHWEKIGMKDTSINNPEYLLFDKTKRKQDVILKQILFDFEQKDSSKTEEMGLVTKKQSFSGKYSNVVPADGFSYTYVISLDSLWSDTISNVIVEADVMYKSLDVKNTVLVVSLEKSQGEDFWESRNLNILSSEWNSAFIVKKLSKEIHKAGILKVYVCNPNKSKGDIYIDNLRIVFRIK